MPICIECRYPVHQLCITYSKAEDRSHGEGVRLTQCPRCKRFADKYIEHDFVVLFIDLVLIKPQVYRHLLFNRLGREDDGLDPSIIRLGVLLLLFDVYLTWARIEKASPLPSPTTTTLSTFTDPSLNTTSNTHTLPPLTSTNTLLTSQPIFLQYLFFLLLCLTESASFHLSIRLLTTHLLSPLFPSLLPTPPRPNSISTALLVSSCTKLFPILMVIWDYDVPAAAKAVGWAVVINNIEALKILLDCGYGVAAGLVGVGGLVRVGVGGGILGAVGLEAGARGPLEVEDLVGGWRVLSGWVGGTTGLG